MDEGKKIEPNRWKHCSLAGTNQQGCYSLKENDEIEENRKKNKLERKRETFPTTFNLSDCRPY